MIRNKAVIIKLTTLFLSEGIIIFLLFSPVFYGHYGWVPYGAYLWVLVSAALLFAMLSRYTDQYVWYMTAAPVVFILYELAGLPVISSAVFAVVLTWRYIVLRGDSFLEMNMRHFQWTAVLAAVLTLVYNSWEIVGFLMLQLGIIVVGHILSHAAVVGKGKRKALIKKLSMMLGSIMLIGGAALACLKIFGVNVFMSFWNTVIVDMWDVAVSAMSYTASLPLLLLDMLNVEVAEMEPRESEHDGGSDTETLTHTFEDHSSTDAFISFIYILVGTVLLGILLYYVYRVIKRRFVSKEEDTQLASAAYTTEKATENSDQTLFNKLKHVFSREPVHPVRRIIYQFERRAEKTGNGREPSETLQEWFKRISLDADVSAYESVRYGTDDVSEADIRRLKNSLAKWEV